MDKLLFLPLLLCSGCSHLAQDNWTGQDKAQHFIASAVFSAAGNEYGRRQHWSETRSNGFGLMFSISLGAAKEFYDSRTAGTGWSWKDFTWDVAGAATGYALWNTGR